MYKRLLLSLLVIATACGNEASHPKREVTSLRFEADGAVARKAIVTVDDQAIGALDFVIARGIAVPRGNHRVTVEAPGYFPWDASLSCTERHQRVRVDLRAIPD